MNKVISKTIKIIIDKLPPTVDFIEASILKEGIKPLRYAIVDVNKNVLTLSVSGFVD